MLEFTKSEKSDDSRLSTEAFIRGKKSLCALRAMSATNNSISSGINQLIELAQSNRGQNEANMMALEHFAETISNRHKSQEQYLKTMTELVKFISENNASLNKQLKP